MTEVIAPARRRLTDLYVVGKLEEINDNSGQPPIVVWIQKLTDAEKSEAGDKANNASMKVKTLMRDNIPLDNPEKAEYLATVDATFDSREAMIEFISTKEIGEKEESARLEIAADEQWAEDGYLESLQNAWNDGVMKRWIDIQGTDEFDEEATRTYDELRRYTDQVNREVEEYTADIIAEYSGEDDEAIRLLCLKAVMERASQIVWMQTYLRQQILISTRDPENHAQRYFEDVAEVGLLQDEVMGKLISAYHDLEVDTLEGKD